MSDKIEIYSHHGMNVSVKSKFKGKHKEMCLCHECKHFYPNTKENCVFAQRAFELSKDVGLALILECEYFQHR